MLKTVEFLIDKSYIITERRKVSCYSYFSYKYLKQYSREIINHNGKPVSKNKQFKE